jgi:hypothetical protein
MIANRMDGPVGIKRQKRRYFLGEVLIALALVGVVHSNTNAPARDLPKECAQAGGNWLEEYQECENTNRDWCHSMRGEFDECASACRHQAGELVPCTMQCVPVCSFGRDSSMPKATDPENCTYQIEDRSVTLVNGEYEEKAAPGSASKIMTKIVLTGAKGYLNDDEYPDVPVLLVHTTGGSGTFFYTSVALGTRNGFRCTNALWIGDRIVPGSIEVDSSVMVLSYTDRYPWESYAIAPSVACSRSFFVVDGQLREQSFPVLSADIAKKTVVADWGDCLPETCKLLSVRVWHGGGGSWYVEATYDGMLDDSVRAQRIFAPAVYGNGRWKIEAPVVKQVQCQQNRGHPEFSAEPCR